MNNKHFRTDGRRTIPDAVGDAEYEAGFRYPGIVINGPPDDACCQICRRHMLELKPFWRSR